MSQLLGVHVVTALVAAGVAFVPQRSVQEAVIAGLVAGTGTVVAEKVAARSQQQLFHRRQRDTQELQRSLATFQSTQDNLNQQLQQQEKEITELKGSLNRLQVERDEFYQRLGEREGRIRRLEESLNAEGARFNNLLQEKEQEIRKLREGLRQKQTDLDQLYQMIDDHDKLVQELEQKNRELEQTLGSLQSTIKNQNVVKNMKGGNTQPNKKGLFLNLSESDFYTGEIQNYVLRALTSYKSTNVYPGSRADHILSSILDNNSAEAEEGNNYQIKTKILLNEIFKDYKTLKQSDRRELESIGFDFTEGKHYCMRFYGDNRYIITFAKTASDWRAGRNIIRDTCQKIFGDTH